MKLQLLVVAAAAGAAQAYCPNYCSGHGECTENDICECYPGFGEADCSVRTCPSGLSWVVGTSNELSSLPTPNGPAGKHPYTECSSQGVCDRATGECDCFDGYTGKACRRAACPNDCSGHGLCVADGDIHSVLDGVSNYGGDTEFLLAPQKQYWNAKMSHQCLCDMGYTGYDCSTRICPVGKDPTTSCDTEADVVDVQAVTVLFGADDANNAEAYLPENIEQFFTLTFTSSFNAQYTTPPISYWDSPNNVQQALLSLPNFVVEDVQVFKMFPRDNDDPNPNPNSATCAEAYFKEYQDITCDSTSDCTAKFPSLSTNGNVFCDTDIKACIESESACEYTDGETEFDNDCAAAFEIDGIYRPNDADVFDNTAFYWGHRLTSFERNCQAGKFASTDSKYTLPCATDADCQPCAGWTTVTNGVCDAVTSTCSSMIAANSDTAVVTAGIYEIASADESANNPRACGVTSFMVKFSDDSTKGRQNDLTCTIDNGDSNNAGAAPMYRSSGLHDCQVSHVATVDFNGGKYFDDSTGTAEVDELIFCIDVSSSNSVLSTSMEKSADCTGGDFNAALDMPTINDFIDSDSVNILSQEGIEYPHSPELDTDVIQTLYTDEEISAALLESTSFADIMPCSNQGSCDYTTGICACGDGYTGVACDIAVTYV